MAGLTNFHMRSQPAWDKGMSEIAESAASEGLTGVAVTWLKTARSSSV
jgi:hypothetical protein